MTEAAADLRRAFEEVRHDALARVEGAGDLDALNEAQVRILGRKSDLARARGSLRSASDADRPALGKLANEVQADIEKAIAEKRRRFDEIEAAARWERERVDVTLPGRASELGSIHPLTRTIWEIVDIFIGLGYMVAEGPEVELSRYNFDALNTPPEHPARSAQDTFYVEGFGEEVCLRTQTSPMQMRLMEKQAPPLYAVIPGRVYRRDVVDATHLNSFAQIEGLAVDEGITMADLKGSLAAFAREVFGAGLDVRLRPHYFPFTEPSAEMDVECFVCRGEGCRLCKGEGWIEVLGCGMVHPFLLEWAGHDPERYTGFAFGIGVERIAQLVYGIPDLRYLYENDLRLLDGFRGIA